METPSRPVNPARDAMAAGTKRRRHPVSSSCIEPYYVGSIINVGVLKGDDFGAPTFFAKKRAWS